MTQLQVEFNKLREQQRANLVNESIKQREAAAKEKEASVKEFDANTKRLEYELDAMKAPTEIQELVANIAKSNAQTDVFVKQLSEINARIDSIKADTRLTQTERERQEVALVNDTMSLVHRITGIDYAGDMKDTIYDWIGRLLGGAGKTVAGVLIG